jgi:hypothetical protein
VASISVALTLFCSAALVCLLSCTDAERLNPLDPDSPVRANSGSLVTEVKTYYAPHLPISDVFIRLQPATHAGNTDMGGRLIFESIEAGSYLLQVTKPGFAVAEDSVVVNPGRETNAQINLDALPTVESLSVNSARIRRRYPDQDLILFEVRTQITDPDGFNDISAVMVEIPDIGFVDTLNVNGVPGSFSVRVSDAVLPGRNLQLVLGHQIFVRAVDLVGFEAISSPVFLPRIIDKLYVPVTFSPGEQEVVDAQNIVLTWQPPMDVAPFPYTFRVEVFLFAFGLNTEVWRQADIPANEMSMLLPVELPPAFYFWTISIVDEFGNWSRSLEATFQVN